jgi:type IV pilus assembly protein PilA
MRKNAIKGFTLIELLVVVAIIGILAAIGVVSFSGFTGSAKINATKANHAQAIKSISAELKKCEIQGGSLSLMSSAPPTTTVNSVVCAKATTTTAAIVTAFVNHFNNSKFTNPYDPTSSGFATSGSTIGQTIVTSSGATITLTTNYTDTNNATQTITATITDERG